MGIVTLVTLLTLMFIVVTGIRMNSRINQLDATLLAVAQRAVALNEGLGSLNTVNESVGKLASQVEVLARTTGEVGARIDQTIKQSETLASQIPTKTAEQVAAGNQNLARQFEGMNGRMQAQAAAVQALGRDVQALKGAVGNVDKLNRDVQALVTLQRERYLEAMQKNAATTGAAVAAERERERSVQYPRVQPPVSPNATPPTTTNSNGAIVVAPRAN
jgi:methyl-accepting chemotaxis protein